MIEAEGLARTFRSRKRTVEAVRGVDLTVDDGEIVGFLGPNGAGKTTTLRMLTTLLTPTAGRATVAGADLLRDPVGVRRRIGYVPQAIGQTGGGSDPNAQVGEELTLQAKLYRVPAAQVPGRTALVARQLELAGQQVRPLPRLAPGDPVQRRLVEQFLHHQAVRVGAAHGLADGLRHVADLLAYPQRVPEQVGAGHRRGPRGRPQQRGQHAQRGGLARAVRPEEADDLPVTDGQVHPPHRLNGPFAAPERPGKTPSFDNRHYSPALRPRSV